MVLVGTSFSSCFVVLLLFSHEVMLDSFATPWAVACQPPVSMRFPRQEYWNRLPFPSLGDLPVQGSTLCLSFGRWILYHEADNEHIMMLKVHWKLNHLPSWTQSVLTSLCHALWLYHSFKGCALSPSLLFHIQLVLDCREAKPVTPKSLFSMWIILSWKRSIPKKPQKETLTSPLIFRKNLDKMPVITVVLLREVSSKNMG